MASAKLGLVYGCIKSLSISLPRINTAGYSRPKTHSLPLLLDQQGACNTEDNHTECSVRVDCRSTVDKASEIERRSSCSKNQQSNADGEIRLREDYPANCEAEKMGRGEGEEGGVIGRAEGEGGGGRRGGGAVGGGGRIAIKSRFNPHPCSPAKTRQSTVAGRVRQKARKNKFALLTDSPRRARMEFTSSLKDRKKTRTKEKKKNKKIVRKRVVSAAFLGGSDLSSEEEEGEGGGGRDRDGGGGKGRGRSENMTRKVEEKVKSRGRGRPPKKRRRLSSSSDDANDERNVELPELAGYDTQGTEDDEVFPETATERSKVKVGWGDCTSQEEEDDMAISKRLEQLQQERREVSMATNADLASKPRLPHTSAIIIPYYLSRDQDNEGVQSTLREGEVVVVGEVGQLRRECLNVTELEIDSSSIVTSQYNLTNLQRNKEHARTKSHRGNKQIKSASSRKSKKKRIGMGATTVVVPTSDCVKKELASSSDTRMESTEITVIKSCSKSMEVNESASGEQRKRGRPRKPSTELKNPRRPPSKPKKPRGHPKKQSAKSKKTHGSVRKKKKKEEERKPGSLPVRRDSGSPLQGSPQNGEDSGYPGSISSSSSAGAKGLKSPQDISPSFLFSPDASGSRSRGFLHHQNHHPPLLPPSLPRPPPPPQSLLPPEQQCRGTINTAELGLFSPEVLDDTHITNFPMPPDPQWVWPPIDAMATEAGSNVAIGNGVDSSFGVDSSSSQSLFDPSKMVIAKVESLSDDSRFNDFLNEILESEEVIECLNSINTETPLTVVEPPPITPITPITPVTPIVTHSGGGREGRRTEGEVEVTVLDEGGAGTTDENQTQIQTPAPVSAPASAYEILAGPSPNVATLSTLQEGRMLSGNFARNNSSSSSETVAAYVAAETSVVPFTASSLVTTAVETSVVPFTASSMVNAVVSNSSTLTTTKQPVPVPFTTAERDNGVFASVSSATNVGSSGSDSYVRRGVLSGEMTGLASSAPMAGSSSVHPGLNNVMWSQQNTSTDESEPLLPLKPPLKDRPAPTATLVSTGGVASRLSWQPSQEFKTEDPPGSSNVKNAVLDDDPSSRKKKTVFRVRVRKSGDGGVSKEASKTKNINRERDGRSNGGKKTKKVTDIPTADSSKKVEERVIQHTEIKSRTGRAIKPSWKLAQSSSSSSSSQSLKRTISPSTYLSRSTTPNEVSDLTPNNSKQPTNTNNTENEIEKKFHKKRSSTDKKKSQGKEDAAKLSLSLSAIVDSNTKKLPDIPATPSSSTPSISLSQVTDTLSMSLDDILYSMTEDTTQDSAVSSEALHFADSLLSTPRDVSRDRDQLPPSERGQKMEEEDEEKEETHMNDEKTEEVNKTEEKEWMSESEKAQNTAVETGKLVEKEQFLTENDQKSIMTSSKQEEMRSPEPTTENTISQSVGNLRGEKMVDETVENREVKNSDLEDDIRCVMMDLCTDEQSASEDSPWPPLPHSPPSEPPPLPSLSSPLTQLNTGTIESVIVGEEEEEDKIDIFADDCDTFTVYTMEEKNVTTPKMPSPPRLLSPTGPEPGCSSRPQYRSNQRHQSHRPRAVSTNSFLAPPTLPLPPPSFPPPCVPVTPQNIDSCHYSTRHPSTPVLPLFPATNRAGGARSSLGGGPPSPLPAPTPLFPSKPCLSYLRGRCHYNRCKFSHASLGSYPLQEIEAMIPRLGVSAIPVEISQHYVTEAKSSSCLWFPDLVKLLMSLTNRHSDISIQAYNKLAADGVLLRPHLLSRLLGHLRDHTHSMLNTFVPLSSLALEILQAIRGQGHCIQEDYVSVLRILEPAENPAQLMDVYEMMKKEGHVASQEVLHLVLRGTSSTDERILQLLSDAKTSLTVSNELARIANGVLEKVSAQLLARKLQFVEDWMNGAADILEILSQDVILKLFNMLVLTQSWSSVLGLVERSQKIVLGVESRLVSPLSTMLVHRPNLSDRVATVLEMMSDDTLYSFPTEGWNAVLTQCLLPPTGPRIIKFCRIIVRSKKSLEQQALDALIEMSISKDEPIPVTEVLTTHLQVIPPVIPSLDTLAKLCQHLLAGERHEDLCMLVERLLQCRVTPSLPILQMFLDSCVKEEAHSRVAALVRRVARKESGVRVEKIFYQRALVILRSWGKDMAAISTIYKCLRTIDTESSLPPMSIQLQPQQSAGESTPGSQTSLVTIATSGRSCKSARSLEFICESSSESSPAVNQGMLSLLENNGKVGQFGAAVSILHNLRDPVTPSTYSNPVVQGLWKAITARSSERKPPNAFSDLLDQLIKPGVSVPECDHWVVSQLGIALMKIYAESKHWQSGYVVLHHLHSHNVKYFAHLAPFAALPPLRPPHPSLFSLAKMAVSTCLRMDSLDLAVQVLRECDWAGECAPGESREREQLLIAMTEKCLATALHEECHSCLQALEGLSMKNEHFTTVTQLYNRLLAAVLEKPSPNVDLGNRIYLSMADANYPCRPRNFSLLLEKLCSLFQFSTARDLCEQAIDQNFYSPITHGELFSVTLPPSVHHVEIGCLVKRHLQRLSGLMEGKVLQTLLIHFEGPSSSVEEGLIKDLSPPLTPVFSNTSCSGGSSPPLIAASVSPTDLLHWLNTHFPNSHFLLVKDEAEEEEEQQQQQQEEEEEEEEEEGEEEEEEDENKASEERKEKRDGAVKEREKEQEKEEKPVKEKEVEKQEVRNDPQCANSISETSIESKREESRTLEKGFDTKQDSEEEEKKKEKKTSLSAPTAPQSTKEKKELCCRTIINQLKLFFQAGRFNSYEDYLFLVKLLTAHVYKSVKGKWTMSPEFKSSVKDLVDNVLSQFTTPYTQNTVIQLPPFPPLASSSSSSSSASTPP